MGGTCGGIFGISTPGTQLLCPRKGGATHDSDTAGCRSTPGHWKTESCSIGVKRLTQRKAAIDSAIALRCNFKVHEEVLEKVEVFTYLSRLLAQDDNDVQAIRLQIRQARGVWARVSQVLRAENTSPRVAAKFYKAVVQSVLLYGSETWNLSRAVLAQLKGFHIRAAHKMARKYKPRKGLFGKLEYPSRKDVLAECCLHSVEEYIQHRRSTIAMCVVNRPLYLECKEGER